MFAIALSAIATVIFIFENPNKAKKPLGLASKRLLNTALVSNADATSLSIIELKKVVVPAFPCTNFHDNITCAIAHQLIAEQLRTNDAFLNWASNAAKMTVLEFFEHQDVPVYRSAGLTAETLQIQNVTVNGLVGIYAELAYDPDPAHEGSLDFLVEGGIRPTILRIENGYRMAAHQLFPGYWDQCPRQIGRTDWSGATAPLDDSQINRLAQKAFYEMTGRELSSFHLQNTKIDTTGVPNPDAPQKAVFTGNLSGKINSRNDFVYPFATFSFDDGNFFQVAFSGEMLQTTPGHGEFVELFAPMRKTEAIFELGEKFLGQGTWEQAMLDKVRSLNADERGQIYRRISLH